MGSKVIAVMGGNLAKDSKGVWHTTSFDEGDNFGIMGDRLRVLAAQRLYEDDERELVALGGLGQLAVHSDAPTIARVIKKELEELGVPPEKIIFEEESGNTYQQLCALMKLAEERGWSRIQVLSNKWHLPRIQAMLEHDSEWRQKLTAGQVELVSAEDVLIEHDSAWEKPIREAYESEAMKERMRGEQEGVQQIKEGTYKLT